MLETAASPASSFEAAADAPSPFAAPPTASDDPSADADVAAELAAFAPPPRTAASAGDGWIDKSSLGAPANASIDNDASIAGSLSPRNPLRDAIAHVRSSRRNMIIAGITALLFSIVIVAAIAGGGDKPKTVASSDNGNSKTDENAAAERESEKAIEAAAAPDPVPEPSPDEAAVVEPAEPPPDEADAGSAAVEPVAAESVAATTPRATPATARPTGRGKTLGGKQVVLEYDAQAKETKAVPAVAKKDQTAIMKARTAYAAGNQRLLAGDWNGAVLKYRQSLAAYPGYVAGYRGLGLAFMQKGDKPKALQALRLYVSSVPRAKDAALIRKRIATLQAQSK